MRVRRLGGADLEVTEVGLGTLTFGGSTDEPTAFAVMDAAYDGGVRLFDTADVYPASPRHRMAGRSEEIVGDWLTSRGVRHQVVLASKVGKLHVAGPRTSQLSRDAIMHACEDSLKRLQTDYIDLYQIHVPDDESQIEETARALDDLIRAGKVRSVGCSNYSVQQFVDALSTSDTHRLTRFESYQARYNVLCRDIEGGVLPLCQTFGVGVLAYGPLGGGLLIDQRATGTAALLGRLAAVEGMSLAHLALGWVLSRPGVTGAIVGASRPAQITDDLNAVNLHLHDKLISACDALWRRPTTLEEMAKCA